MSEVRRCFVPGCSLKKLVMLAPLLRAGDLATNAGADTEDMFLRVCVPGQTLEPLSEMYFAQDVGNHPLVWLRVLHRQGQQQWILLLLAGDCREEADAA